MAALTGAATGALIQIDGTANERAVGVQRIGQNTGATISVSVSAQPAESDGVWSAVLLDRTGARLCSIPPSAIGALGETLNGAESIQLSLPVDGGDMDAARVVAALNSTIYPEVQVRRGRHVRCWGPVTDRDDDGHTMTAQVNGPLWYFDRRFFGPVPRTNQIIGGDFTLGFQSINAGWQKQAQSALGGYVGIAGTFSTVTDPTIAGYPYTAKIDPASSTTGAAFGFMRKSFQYRAPADRGVTLSLSAFVWIADTGLAGNYSILKIVSASLAAPNASTFDPSTKPTLPTPADSAFVQSTDPNITRGEWQFLSCSVDIAAGDIRFITVLLGGLINNASYFSHVEVLDAGSGTTYSQTDAAAIACSNIVYAQDPAKTKTDLGIDTQVHPTGVLIDRTYPDQNHDIVGSVNSGLCSDGYIDQWMVATSTTRTYHAGARKGSYKPNLRLVATDAGHNCVVTRRTFQGSSGASEVIGQAGSGFPIDENASVDLAAFDGLLLENLFTAPPEIGAADLVSATIEQLRAQSNPTEVTVTVDSGSPHIDGLLIGDSTDLYVLKTALQPDGSTLTLLEIDGRYRLTQKTTDPTSDTAELVLDFWTGDAT